MLIKREREENKTCEREREGGEKREEKKLSRTAQDKEAISYTYRHIMRPAKLLTHSPMYVTRQTCLFSDHMPKHTLLILMRTHKTYTRYSYPPPFWSCWTFSACTSLARPPHLFPHFLFPKTTSHPQRWTDSTGGEQNDGPHVKKKQNIKTECRAKCCLFFFFPTRMKGLEHLLPRVALRVEQRMTWTQDPSHDSLLEMHRRRGECMQC